MLDLSDPEQPTLMQLGNLTYREPAGRDPSLLDKLDAWENHWFPSPTRPSARAFRLCTSGCS